MTPAFTLARWFQMERYADRPEDDFVREEILHDLYHAERVAKSANTVLVKTPNGACMIEVVRQDNIRAVTFDYVEDRRWTRTLFWMNVSSVRNLLQHLETVPRADFNDLFFGEGAVR